MRTILYTAMTVIGLIIVIGIGYAMIQLFNDLLYQIFIHTERTLVIVASLTAIYSAILYSRHRRSNNKA